MGTGDGTIHILSVKAAEPTQAEVHTQDTPTSLKIPEDNVSGGLVTVEEGEEGNGEESIKEEEASCPPQDHSHIPTMSRLHRKSKFGKTLRHRKRPNLTKKSDNIGPYELTIEASRHVVESRKEPVRTLQTCL